MGPTNDLALRRRLDLGVEVIATVPQVVATGDSKGKINTAVVNVANLALNLRMAKTRAATIAAGALRIVRMVAVTTGESHSLRLAAMAKKKAPTRAVARSILNAAHMENLRGEVNLDPDVPIMILMAVEIMAVLGVNLPIKRLAAPMVNQIAMEKEPPTPAVSRAMKINLVHQDMEEPRALTNPLVAVETSTALPDMAGVRYDLREADIQVEATNALMVLAEEKTNTALLDRAKADDQTITAGRNKETRIHTVPPDMAGRRDDPKDMVAEDMKAKETRKVLMDPAEEKADIAHLDMANQRDMEDDLEMRNAHTDPLGVVETSTVLPDTAGLQDTPLATAVARLLVLKDSISAAETAMILTTVSDMVAMVAVTVSMTLTIS